MARSGVSFLKEYPVSFISTYPPKRCGIGTFAHDLASAMADLHDQPLSSGDHLKVYALQDEDSEHDYGEEVSYEINAGNRMDYKRAAEDINISQTRVVSLQHEFGIFGGDDGEYILTTLRRLRKPVVTTLHTILEDPSEHQKEVLTEVCQRSSEVVVLADKASKLLVGVYGISGEKITKIHHGAPDVPFLDTSYYKEDFGFARRKTILTFGLLSKNKGIEMGIDAMSEVKEEFPEALYIVLGQTHPNIKRESGEEYRISLKQRVARLDLEENVLFRSQFVPKEELYKYLVSADIYLTPYRAREQISSGTLAYAVATGRAIVSTPYWYAEELLADDRGRLVPFDDPSLLGKELKELLGDEGARQRLRKNAYDFGRDMIWEEVAATYQRVFEEVGSDYSGWEEPAIKKDYDSVVTDISELPEVKLDHLRELTDGTGMLQHANYTVPDRSHGYTTDDNARAALAVLRHWKVFEDESVIPLLNRYLSFIQYSLQCGDGMALNFMSYDRSWKEPESGSQDCHGRVLWALGKVASKGPEGVRDFATRFFHGAMGVFRSLSSPRALAFASMGLVSYLKRFEEDENARKDCERLVDRLMDGFRNNVTEEWPWPEDVVSYENARLPQALIVAGRHLDRKDYLDMGLRSFDWLFEIQTADDGHISPIGSNGWLTRDGSRADFDQQPVEVAALIDTAYQAYLATEELKYVDYMNRAFDWYLGGNDLEASLYDFQTGGCRDGLHPDRVNKNEGAESQLAWLLSLYKLYQVMGEVGHSSE